MKSRGLSNQYHGSLSGIQADMTYTNVTQRCHGHSKNLKDMDNVDTQRYDNENSEFCQSWICAKVWKGVEKVWKGLKWTKGTHLREIPSWINPPFFFQPQTC